MHNSLLLSPKYDSNKQSMEKNLSYACPCFSSESLSLIFQAFLAPTQKMLSLKYGKSEKLLKEKVKVKHAFLIM